MSGFWLSHHSPEECHRTYKFGNLQICARCLGTYPVLMAGLVVQLACRAPLRWDGDVGWALLLPAPALVDWSVGHFCPRFGSNLIRTATGILLGAGLARTLYIHLHHPFPALLGIQLGACGLISVAVLAFARR